MPTRRPLSDRSGPMAPPRSTKLVATRFDLGVMNALRGDLVGVDQWDWTPVEETVLAKMIHDTETRIPS